MYAVINIHTTDQFNAVPLTHSYCTGVYDSISNRTTDTDEAKGAAGSSGSGLLSRIFGGKRDDAAGQVNTGDPAAAVEESLQVVEDAKGMV
jgi:hypothetical protein